MIAPASFWATSGISKAPGILEPPNLRVTAPGSSMPVVQSALESADGKSYYSLYPLRPGTTTFEVQQLLPYASKRYTFVKRFYQDIAKLDVGVIPQDMAVSGTGLTKVQTDSQKNFSVYSSAPVKGGTDVVWEFSGGTPVPEAEPAAAEGELARQETISCGKGAEAREISERRVCSHEQNHGRRSDRRKVQRPAPAIDGACQLGNDRFLF